MALGDRFDQLVCLTAPCLFYTGGFSRGRLVLLLCGLTATPCLSTLHLRQNKTDPLSIVYRLFGSDVEQESKCRCDKQQTRISTTLLYDLDYPDVPQGKRPGL